MIHGLKMVFKAIRLTLRTEHLKNIHCLFKIIIFSKGITIFPDA